ncbi:MAG: ubiquinone/menaquinone biosynthesis methyltransferase [Chloroflexota bacterium]
MSQTLQRIFAEVPHTYEALNHFLTFGQDILWRRKAARAAAAGGKDLWLDACGGTGEMTACLARLAEAGTQIVVADFSLPMMRKALARPEAGRVAFTSADVGHLPFRDSSFDALTISFATRNITTSREHLMVCLHEFYRVLKTGGRFVMLETSQPKHGPIRRLFHVYVRVVVAPMGRLISGSPSAYEYLSNSMCNFYSPEELGEILKEAGFRNGTFNSMLLGAAALHVATK